MPSLNLRLSEEDHARLVGWAAENGRSLQREVVWRLFRGRDEDGVEQFVGGVRPGVDIRQAQDSANVPVPAPYERSFRPDPKVKKKP